MSSNLSLLGSFEKDLCKSKLWLAKHLHKTPLGKVYILGSWYGNTGLILNHLGLNFDKIVNVDTDQKYIDTNKELYHRLGFKKSWTTLCKDCNNVNYKGPHTVINTSINDIENNGWFDRIPQGTLVALQTRDNVEYPQNLNTLDKEHPMSEIMFLGKKSFTNSDGPYHRFMKIGIK